MAQYGRLKEFDADSEPITAYLERVELFFEANDVGDGKRVPILLSNIGPKTYGLLRSLTAPKAPKEKSFKELSELLKAHFEPAPIVIAERYRFHRRDQAAGESIGDYVAELRRLTAHCQFEATTDYLEEALRDRFVCGLKNESTRKRLLTETGLTFSKALEIAKSLETAAKDAQQLKGSEQTGTVHNVASRSPRKEACYRCGRTNHRASDCKFKEAVCHNCGKRGHLKRRCKQPQRGDRRGNGWRRERTKWVDREQNSEEDPDENLGVYVVEKLANRPIQVELQLDGKPVTMEVDTGAAVSLISEWTLKQVLPKAAIHNTTVVLRTYTSERIPVRGELQVMVQYGNQKKRLTLYVTKGEGPCIMGREWLKSIRLDWRTIGLATMDATQTRLHTLLETYKEVFRDELGTMNSVKAELKLKENVTPRFHRPRPVPFALKGAVEQELARLEEKGILKKVSHSSWAAPVVPVPKKDGKVRICGDYKVTVNPHLDVDQHPLPRPEELFATLANGKAFTKIDLSQAYQQMQLEESSAQYLTINTHTGLYQYTRLPFGVASAPAIFQRAMDMILQGIDGVICYIDDILVTGITDKQHLERLDEVLKRLKTNGLRVKREKCAFFRT